APPAAPGDAAPADDAGPTDEHAELEDESEDDAASPAERPRAHAPGMALDDAAFAAALKHDPASLGPMSVGRPSAGLLVGGVQVPESPAWRLVDPAHAWGTQESVDSIARAVQHVRDRFEDTPPIAIGHLSARRGGPLSPHKSHQSGRDVDIGYYYTTNAPWFARATAQNLDRARTWELVKAFADDAEMIFIDTSVQKLLREYALAHGEDKALVDRLIQFGSPNRRTVVRHIPGHATHIHVRFTSPMACEIGARAEPLYRAELERVALAARQRAQAEHHAGRSSKAAPAANDKGKPNYFEHRVRPGDTLYRLAQRYGVSVDAIQHANGLKGFALKPKMVLRIPTKG
ncbi:MAG TPA: penicillin-insensitive murein endopeptidase, partial [Minicystis sp.]|nr:penicillin-insensitive murein endopeptidase [Minicystis sp.]